MKIKYGLMILAFLLLCYVFIPIEGVKSIKISFLWNAENKTFPITIRPKLLGEIEVANPQINLCNDCGERSQTLIFTADFREKAIEDEKRELQGGIKIIGKFEVLNVLGNDLESSKRTAPGLNSMLLHRINFVATEPIRLGFASDQMSFERKFQELVYELEKRSFQSFPVYYLNEVDLCHLGRYYNPKSVQILGREGGVLVTLEAGDISVKCLASIFAFEN